MQSVHDFVTSFFSKEAVAPQEPATDTSKVDTQDDIGYGAVTQELATDPTGATQEPPVGEQKEDDLDVVDTQEPATDQQVIHKNHLLWTQMIKLMRNNNSLLHWNLQLQKPRLL